MRKKSENKIYTDENIAFLEQNKHKGHKFCAERLNLTVKQVDNMSAYVNRKKKTEEKETMDIK